ncbi:MAG: OmpA family protein, partial [Prochlorotrichaceae cyanobacterium]
FVQYQEALKRSRELEEKVAKYERILQSLPEIIRSQLEQKLGETGNFKVDPQTGDLQIGDRILFDENSSTLNANGKLFLRQFIPVYSDIIFSLPEDLGGQISRIFIEGSTSSSGSDLQNMSLSVQRGTAVYDYIFNDPSFPQFSTKELLRQKIVVSGRGELDSDQQKVNPSDRRVTFKFQIRRPTFLENSENLQTGSLQ